MSSVHHIPRGDITLGKQLGKGGFAEVFEGTRRGDAPVAVKRLFDGLSEQSKTSFRHELIMMCQLRSDYVVSVYGLVDDAPHQPMLLVMERMHENLFHAYSSDPAPSLRQRVEWLLQAGRGISFLHAQSPPILHRDIKPANMLLTSPATGRRLKMSDFGLCKSLADITASVATRSTVPAAGGGSAAAAEVGTPHYKAPEIMSMKPKYSAASDVYAFGVVCWEVICMRLPYRDCSDLQEIKAGVKAGDREEFELEDCPDFVFPPALKAMIERAWAQDAKQRPSIDQCVRELQQFLEQLDAEAAGGVDASPRTHTIPPRRQLSAPDSRVPAPTIAAPPPDSSIISPPDSSVVSVQQLASLTDVQVAFLVDTAGSNFKAKGYGQAAVNKKVDGNFMLKANESELTALFSQMGVDAVDMPALREAVSSWKADPAQVFSCLAQAAASTYAPAPAPASAAAKAAAAAFIAGKPDIIAAARSGDISLVGHHVTAEPSCVNAKDSVGYTALICSAANGHLEVCKLLVSSKCDVNSSGQDGYTALMHSANKGHLEVCKLLVSSKCDVNSSDQSGNTALMQSAMKGHLEVCKLLVSSKCDVNSSNQYGYTALMFSAMYGHLEVCKLLVSSKADLAARDSFGRTALKWAMDQNKSDVVAFLRSIGAPQ